MLRGHDQGGKETIPQLGQVPAAFRRRLAGAIHSLAVRTATVHLEGVVRDETRVLDYYIFVGARKIVYRSNRNGADARSAALNVDLPLRPGSNLVTIVAREDYDTIARRAFVIRRDGPAGELLATPRLGQADHEEEEEE